MNAVFSKAMKRLWTGRCSVINFTDVTDENGVTETVRKVIAEDEPCRVAYETDDPGSQTHTVDEISKEIKLFIDNKVPIMAGSEIIVTQNRVERHYISAGIPAVYFYHQEVKLVDKEVNA